MKLLGTFLTLTLSLTSLQANAYTVEKDVEYDFIDGKSLKLDVYSPSNPGTALRPGIIYTHGGCFSSGSKADIPAQLISLADSGITVFSVDYRKYPDRYPKGKDDVMQAIRFIRKNSARFQTDPNKLGTHGESAGGYLAAIVGVRPLPDRAGKIDQYSGRVQFVSDWYGRTDFTRTQPASGSDCAVSFLGMARTADTMKYFVEASVNTYVDANSAQFQIIHGTHDQQVEPAHSVLLANKLWDAGRPANFALVEFGGHGFGGTDVPWRLTKNFFLKSFGLTEQAKTTGSSSAVQGINAGNSTTLASLGTFTGDRFFEGGWQHTYSPAATTANTTLQDLFKTVRAGNFTYKIPANSGVYKLTLHMAEKQYSVSAAGQRVFDINLLVKSSWSSDPTLFTLPVIPAMDIYARAGGKDRAIKRELIYISRGGTPVNVNASSKLGNPIISGIELAPYPY